jgi:hypothetical protein
MYFFVRFNGIVNIVLGILLMLCGVGVAIYGFLQNAVLVDFVNNFWLANSNSRLLDARFYAAALGLLLFLLGMCVAACGQLFLVFADVAANTRESNQILRGIRKLERVEAAHAYEQPYLAPAAPTAPAPEVEPAALPSDRPTLA